MNVKSHYRLFAYFFVCCYCRFGRKPIIVISYVTLVVLHFVCAASPGYPFFMTWRFVMGYVTSTSYGVTPTLSK